MKVYSNSVLTGFIGFALGVVLIISCDSNNSNPLMKNANASVPQISDQMVCYAWYENWFGPNRNISGQNIECQLQSETTTTMRYTSLSAIFADGWTVISTGGGDSFMAFYK